MRCLLMMLIFCCWLPTISQASQENAPLSEPLTTQIPVLSINGAIGPAISDYLTREITRINQQNSSPLIILTLDTPGGLSTSLRVINQSILNSSIPIACLVYPEGARAASAGTYLLYACHIAAMANATTLGAATPVMLSGPSITPKDNNDKDSQASAMEKKVLNDSIAYIRSLAQLRQRNAEWAEKAVKDAATLTATEALEMQVINLIANTPAQLLNQLDGYQVALKEQLITLSLKGGEIKQINPDWRSQFIATITDPNIAYIMLMIGIYGLILEFYSPGIGVGGVIGGIALLVALYALQMLPLNFVGLGLLLLGISLLIIEAMMPSFGIFGIGGLIAFVIGSIFLIDTDQSYFKISLELITALAITSGLFFIFILGYLWRLRKKRVVSGQESLIGGQAIAIDNCHPSGFVSFEGERWTAQSQQPLAPGQTVIIQAINGLVLQVIAKQTGESTNGTDRQH
ncbi:serine protease [Thalassotalea insulae]|uniref:Serine protease n=1 Tax=Thalassotalea insulae TaxID=2056778 RepID=A0ABQ6GM48_9GAMM|nr:nodulation protein NfeD [Thalassotalea insulae]GLX76992.1 serine protease [Thalassotalea insulae]